MPIPASHPVVNETLVRALSWTLLHSLWQGMILAMVAALILVCTKKLSSAMRYNLLTASMVVFIASMSYTFMMQLMDAAAPGQGFIELRSPLGQDIVQQDSFIVQGQLSFTANATNTLNNNAVWIAMGWLLVILWRLVWLSAGIYRLVSLKTREISSPGAEWEKRFTELRRQLQVSAPVQLLQSGLTRIPVVVGFLKPVVLLPVGMLTALPPAEVEAILMHELAHIRRKDILVNLLQHFVEIVFFFNPAVKWVSNLIRTERENSCDDIAVGYSSDKRNYINALIAFEGSGLAGGSTLVNAFAADKGHLLDRVKRIINNHNKTLNYMEKKFLIAGIVLTSMLTFAFSPAKLRESLIAENPGPTSSAIYRPATEADTIPRKGRTPATADKSTIIKKVDGKKYKVITKDGQVSELYVNDKKIPAEKLSSYQDIMDDIMEQLALEKSKSDADMDRSMHEVELSLQKIEESRAEMEALQEKIEESSLEMKEAHEKMELDLQQHENEINKENLHSETSEQDMKRAKIELEEQKKIMDQELAQNKLAIEQSRKEFEKAKIEMERAKKDIEQSKKQLEESKKMQEAVVNDLIREKIIVNKSELRSCVLNIEALIVNGVKQPDAIHKKFKQKYVKGDNWTMSLQF